jgi:hypothetical protein
MRGSMGTEKMGKDGLSVMKGRQASGGAGYIRTITCPVYIITYCDIIITISDNSEGKC